MPKSLKSSNSTVKSKLRFDYLKTSAVKTEITSSQMTAGEPIARDWRDRRMSLQILWFIIYNLRTVVIEL